MSLDVFIEEFYRVLARVGAVVVVLLLIYYLYSSLFGISRTDLFGIVREAITTTVARVV
jgi:hypothetical protein